MVERATRRPARQRGLVSWRTGVNGYLVRNRLTGESFRLGEQEYFLLEQLDGRQARHDICLAFAGRFAEPLSELELEEFVELSSQRGLLQPAFAGADNELIEPGQMERSERSRVRAAHAPLGTRCKVRLLKGICTCLQRLTWLPNLTVSRLHERLRHLQFVPRPDDLFLVTYPRSGTTWMQMILYQLTTDGSMEFSHIAEYCPWFERSLRARWAFETRPSPRLFKSHLPYSRIPKGLCKYIYVARNGKDVAVSYYHLYRKYNGFEGSFSQFFDWFLEGKTVFGCWLEHVAEWWAHRDDPQILFLTYDELQRDLEGAIRRIARFIGREVPPEELPRIVDRCGFGFMKQHESKFDPAMESLWEQGIQLHSFLRNGRTGDGTVCLSAAQQLQFDEAFGERLDRLGIPLR